MKWAAAATVGAFALAAAVWQIGSVYLAPGWAGGLALAAAGSTLTLAGMLGAPRRQRVPKSNGAVEVATAQPQRVTA